MSELSQQEAKLYDRQLRLWGVAAQQLLRKSKILLYGFNAVQSEICKNLVLAGIQSVTIGDGEACVMKDLSAHLFLDTSVIGKNRAEASLERIKALNPNVQVCYTKNSLQDIDFSEFDLCCIAGLSIQTILYANEKARKSNTLFVAVDSFGFFGFMFEDIGNLFTYQKTIDNEPKRFVINSVSFDCAIQKNLNHDTNLVLLALKVLSCFENRTDRIATVSDANELVKIKNELIEPLRNTGGRRSIVNRATDEFIISFAQSLGTELSPVCAIVGGIVAQDIVKLICRNDDPFLNFFFYNGLDDDNPGNVENIF